MLRGARLHVTGIVQGVGFRPFVYNLANRHHLRGWIRNTTAGVEIDVDGEADAIDELVRSIRAEAPPLARIEDVTVTFGASRGFTTFEIRNSESIPEAFQPVSPDVAICGDCLRELFDPADRRYRYPFINCTNCGPRFTIIQDIPYDRPQTTMAGFVMCADCAREYADPQDRRFHAQPIACPACGPRVWLEPPGWEPGSPVLTEEGAITEARRRLASGGIVAVKGLGGFHLACDATRQETVRELRSRKLRVDKPFAVMLPDLAGVEMNCWVNENERLLLQSPARPIVLLRRRSDSIIATEVAPGQDWIGVMLPYTPLHHLLMERAPSFPTALVMTSGNIIEEPIATGNEDARHRLGPLAEALLMHDRDIHVRCDDSVLRVVDGSGGPAADGDAAPAPGNHEYPLRRSRGYVPFPVKLPWQAPPVLAVGGELKNTFCLTNRDYGFLSHHIGDLENYETLQSFETGIAHFEHLFRVRPAAISFDLHPDYLATRYAARRAAAEGLTAMRVQHHHAHVAACMAEHRLDGAHPVLGAAFDGTGLGDDGAVWGGEMLSADYLDFKRLLHLRYFPLPGGDAAVREPARVALGLLRSLGLEWDEDLPPVSNFGAQERSNLEIQLDHRLNCPMTSSMGRLFDAAASLAGVRQTVNYEAQAAIEFEAKADETETGAYAFDIVDGSIDWEGAVEALVGDVRAGVGVPKISARFHNGVAQMVASSASRLRSDTGLNEIALTGGVWQNITLLRRTLSLLVGQGFQVYLHKEVPANDGGLSLGQAVIAAARLRVGYVSRSTGADR